MAPERSDDRTIAGLLADRTILLVEDESFTRHIVGRLLLRESGCTVHTAIDGQDGLSRLASLDGAVDCIISDLDMLPVSGLELLRAVRAGDSAALRACPFLLLTGVTSGPAIDAARALDVQGCLAKPVSRATLRLRLAIAFGTVLQPRPAADYRAVPLPRPMPAPVFANGERTQPSIDAHRYAPLLP